jgi:hypothetical protein
MVDATDFDLAMTTNRLDGFGHIKSLEMRHQELGRNKRSNLFCWSRVFVSRFICYALGISMKKRIKGAERFFSLELVFKYTSLTLMYLTCSAQSSNPI